MTNLRITELPTLGVIEPADVIPIVDLNLDVTKKVTIAQLDARYGSIVTTGNLTGTNIAVTGGSGAVVGAGVNISLPQPVGPSANPTFANLTVNMLDVDNINIDGSTIITKNTNGDLILSPNGTGKVQFAKGAVFNDIVNINSNLILDSVTDSSSSGSNQTLVQPAKSIMYVTNAGLASVQGFSGGIRNKLFIFTNKTAAPIVLRNAMGTSTQQIITGSGTDMNMAVNASVWLYYASDDKFYVIGGSGGGGGGIISVNGDTGPAVVLTSADIEYTSGVSVEDQLDSLVVAVGTLQTDYTALELRMDDVEADIVTIDGYITSLEGRMTTAEADIIALEGNVTTLQGQMTTAQADILLRAIGAASSTDNAVSRFDGTTGKTLQNSLLIVDDAGVVSGATQLNVDNLRLDGSVLSSTNTNGNIEITPNGTGVVNITKALLLNGNFTATENVEIQKKLKVFSQTDSTATGANATVAVPNSGIIRLTNAGLLSVEGITAVLGPHTKVTLTNETANAITILNNTGSTAANKIYTGIGNMILPSGASIDLYERDGLGGWNVIGVTNNVSIPLMGAWIAYTPTISVSTGVLPTRSSELFWYKVDGTDILLKYSIQFSGTGTGNGFYTFSLPNGWNIDTTVSSTSNFASLGQFGVGGWFDNSSTPQGPIIPAGTGTTTTLQFYGSDKGSVQPTSANLAASDRFYGIMRIPISELSQNTVGGLVSQSIMYRLSAQRITSSQSITTTAATDLVFNSVAIGNPADFNTSTGTWTCSKTGWYNVDVTALFSNSTAADYMQLRLRHSVTGTIGYNANYADGSGRTITLSRSNIYMVQGQTLNVSIQSQTDTSYNFDNNTGVFWDIQEVPFSSTSIATGMIPLGVVSLTDNQANAVSTGTFYRSGNRVYMDLDILFSGAQSGSFDITVPTEYTPNLSFASGRIWQVGPVLLRDNGTGSFAGDLTFVDATTLRVRYVNSSGSNNLANTSATTPFTWVSTDTITGLGLNWPVVGW